MGGSPCDSMFVPSLPGVPQQVWASQVKYAVGVVVLLAAPPIVGCRTGSTVAVSCVCVCVGGMRGGEALMSRRYF